MAKWGYKELLSERGFLNVKRRANALKAKLVDVDINGAELRFYTRSGSMTGLVHVQRVVILALSDYLEALRKEGEYIAQNRQDLIEELEKQHHKAKALETMSDESIRRALRDSSLRVSCTCSAYHYYGFKYYAYKEGYGIYEETRRPVKRQPVKKGNICKHLYATLRIYPYVLTTVISKLKDDKFFKSLIEAKTNLTRIERLAREKKNPYLKKKEEIPAEQPLEKQLPPDEPTQEEIVSKTIEKLPEENITLEEKPETLDTTPTKVSEKDLDKVLEEQLQNYWRETDPDKKFNEDMEEKLRNYWSETIV